MLSIQSGWAWAVFGRRMGKYFRSYIFNLIKSIFKFVMRWVFLHFMLKTIWLTIKKTLKNVVKKTHHQRTEKSYLGGCLMSSLSGWCPHSSANRAAGSLCLCVSVCVLQNRSEGVVVCVRVCNASIIHREAVILPKLRASGSIRLNVSSGWSNTPDGRTGNWKQASSSSSSQSPLA